MKLKHLTGHALSVKTLDVQQGIAEMIVSVFNNIDSTGERILPGFFAKSLERKLPKGVWMHKWDTPVAKTLAAKELMPGDLELPIEIRELGGLKIKSHFNLDTQRGKEAFSDLMFGTVDEFSIGFVVTKEERADDGVLDLLEGDLYEWSPVLVGANPSTSLISAKALAAKMRFKSELLGDDVEESMTMAALSRLNDRLFYWFLYEVLFSDETTLDAKLATMRLGFDEFRDIALRTVEGIMKSEGAETADEAQSTMKALRIEYSTKDEPDNININIKNANVLPRAGTTLLRNLESVLAAVKGVGERAQSVNALRRKEGRVLSSDNHERLKGVSDAMKAACGDLDLLLDSVSNTTPQKSGLTASEVRVRQARRRAHLRELGISLNESSV